MALTTIEVIDGLKALLTEKHLELATVQSDITTAEQKLKDLKAREKDKLAIVKMEIVEKENDLLLLKRAEEKLIEILKKCGEV